MADQVNGHRAFGTTLLDVDSAPAQGVAPVPAPQDPVAAHYCKTLKQIRDRRFDVVIVGGGAVGCTVAHEILAHSPKLSVLVLEKGSFLLPEHVQNIDPRYQPLIAEAIAKPWERTPGTVFDLAPQIPYLGGRALFWSTWIPRPTRAQMPGWPAGVLSELDKYWDDAESFLGAVLPSEMGPEFTAFQPYLMRTLFERLKRFPQFLTYKDPSELEVMLASRDTTSSLGYRKFSPVARLLTDTAVFGDRFEIVTGCEVELIRHEERGGKRHATELITAQGRLPLNGAQLVLANGVVEPTGLVLDSFAGVVPAFAGTNLGGHVASWFSVRVPRASWKKAELPDELQIGCMYLRGHIKEVKRDFHIHLMAASNPDPSTAVADLYRLIPDAFDQEFLTQLSSRTHIGFLVHCLGEWRSEPMKNGARNSWVGVRDGVPQLNIVPSAQDTQLRTKMDEAALALTREVLCGDPKGKIEYWQPGTDTAPGKWIKEPPPARLKDALVHESGTLWMGPDARTSVTDTDCRLHIADNVYIGGAATFPTSGSWNPTLTAVALGMRLAEHVVTKASGGSRNGRAEEREKARREPGARSVRRAVGGSHRLQPL